MPNYKKHLYVASIAFYLTIFIFIIVNIFNINNFNNFSLNNLILWFLSILAGSLFPDIDIKSKGQRLFYAIFLFIIIISLINKLYFLALCIFLLLFIPIFAKHRGIFHNIWFLMALIFIVYKILIYNFPDYNTIILTNLVFFTIGMNTHLWLDMGPKMFKIK